MNECVKLIRIKGKCNKLEITQNKLMQKEKGFKIFRNNGIKGNIVKRV